MASWIYSSNFNTKIWKSTSFLLENEMNEVFPVFVKCIDSFMITSKLFPVQLQRQHHTYFDEKCRNCVKCLNTIEKWQKKYVHRTHVYKQFILPYLLVIRCLSLLHDMLLVHRITEQIFAMQFLEENVLSFPNTIFYLLTKKQQSTKSLIFVFL